MTDSLLGEPGRGTAKLSIPQKQRPAAARETEKPSRFASGHRPLFSKIRLCNPLGEPGRSLVRRGAESHNACFPASPFAAKFPVSDQLSSMSDSQRITVPGFTAMKQAGQKISMLTAYDYTMAQLLDESGVEGILVGDSMSMVVQGHANTLPVTMDEMIYHAEMVGRAVSRALVVVDMPFPSFHLGQHRAIENAGRILKETRCQAVKLEGGVDQCDTIAALTSAGIPVMAHCGLQPQNIHQLGGYKVHRDEEQLLADAQAAEAAGAFAIVLECIPSAIAQKITQTIHIPTIGIGAGADCDGQVLVINDVLGLTAGNSPRFVKPFANLRSTISDAVHQFREEVRDGTFPADEHQYR